MPTGLGSLREDITMTKPEMTQAQMVQDIIASNYADLFMEKQIGRDFDIRTAIKNAYLSGVATAHTQLKNAIIGMEREAKAIPVRDPFEET